MSSQADDRSFPMTIVIPRASPLGIRVETSSCRRQYFWGGQFFSAVSFVTVLVALFLWPMRANGLNNRIESCTEITEHIQIDPPRLVVARNGLTWFPLNGI